MAIYLDNASTTAIDEAVLEAMMPFLTDSFGNPSSTHSFGRKAKAAIETGRKDLAALLNVSPLEICFNSGGTEGNNTALTAAVRDLGVTRIITSPIEHKCVLNTANHLAECDNIELAFAQLDNNGVLDMAALEAQIKSSDKKTLLTLMHANNEIGNMIDFAAVSKLCQETNTLFHSDTVQSFGYHPFDLQETPIDFMTCSAHKFHGPKGIGFLYVNKKHKIKPLIQGGGQERNMRSGTLNAYAIVGLCAAAKLAYEKREANVAHIKALKQQLVEGLKPMGVRFNGDDPSNTLCKVVNVAFPPSKYSDIFILKLDLEGFCVSAGSACSSGASKGSHVLNAVGAEMGWPCIRISFGKYNTAKEIDELLFTLKGLLQPELVTTAER